MRPSQLYGSAYLASQLRGQSRYPFRPLTAVLADQSRRVRAMVAYAYRYVPFYRETLDRLGLRPQDFRTARDLERLPVIETEAYQRDPDRFLSTAQPREAYLAIRTSGSSGHPRTLYHDWRGVAQNAAHAERDRALVADLLGHPRSYRETVIKRTPESSTPHLVQQMLRRHVWFPTRMGIERQYLRTLDPLETIVAQLNEFRPHVLHVNGSYLALFFGYPHRTGAACHLPRVLTYGSEGASESIRRLIMDEFGVPVLSAYQTTEAFKLGFECDQHVGYHLNLDLYPLRLVNSEGQAVPDGETGEVVISNLVNRATVLLNYRLNDLAHLIPEPCPCGRTLPLLSFLQGRGRDFLDLGSGRVLHPALVDGLFTNQEGIWQYQVVQKSRSQLAVAVLVAPGVNQEGVRSKLLTGFREACGEGVTIEIAFVDRIPSTPGGKVPPVVGLSPDTNEPTTATGAQLS